MYILAS